jgi:hypothetical protein
MLKIIWHLLIVFVVLIIQHGAAMSTEEPKYTIEVKKMSMKSGNTDRSWSQKR